MLVEQEAMLSPDLTNETDQSSSEGAEGRWKYPSIDKTEDENESQCNWMLVPRKRDTVCCV